MRHLAALNGEGPLQPATTNWNLFLNDREREGIVNCTTKLRLFEKQREATWTSIERPFEREDRCKGLEYGVALRDPLETAESTISYNDVDLDELASKLTDGLPPKGMTLQHRGVMDHVSPLGHFDNFMTRSLLGRRAFDTIPIGGVTTTHLRDAIAVLAEFDVILVLDDLDTHLLQFAHRWSNVRSTSHRYNAHPDRKPMSNDTRNLLRSHAAIDILLYDAARDIAQKRTRRAQDLHRIGEKRTTAHCASSTTLSPLVSSTTTTTTTTSNDETLRECAGGTFPLVDSDGVSSSWPPSEEECASETTTTLKVLGVASSPGHMEGLFQRFCGLGYVVVAAEMECNFEALHSVRRDGAIAATRDVRNLREACFGGNCRVATWTTAMRGALQVLAASGVEVLLDFDYAGFLTMIIDLAPDLVVVHAVIPLRGDETGVVCKPAFWPKTNFSPLNSFEACTSLAADVGKNATHLTDVAVPMETLRRRDPDLLAEVILRFKTHLTDVAVPNLRRRDPDLLTEVILRFNTFVRRTTMGRARYIPFCSLDPVLALPWRRAKDMRLGPVRGEHVVVTALGIEDDRLEIGVLLFEAFTLPSMVKQTNDDAVWLIYGRYRRWPAALAERIAAAVAPFPRFRLVDDDMQKGLLDDNATVHLGRAGIVSTSSISIVTLLDAGDSLHPDALRETQQIGSRPSGRNLTICSEVAYEWTPSERGGNYGSLSSLSAFDDGNCWGAGLSRVTRASGTSSSSEVIALPWGVAPLTQKRPHVSRRSMVQRKNTSTTDFLKRRYSTLDATMTLIAVANAHILHRRWKPDDCEDCWSPQLAAARLERLCSTRSILDRIPCRNDLNRLNILSTLLTASNASVQMTPLRHKRYRHRYSTVP